MFLNELVVYVGLSGIALTILVLFFSKDGVFSAFISIFAGFLVVVFLLPDPIVAKSLGGIANNVILFIAKVTLLFQTSDMNRNSRSLSID